jgi:hypothetical protein
MTRGPIFGLVKCRPSFFPIKTVLEVPVPSLTDLPDPDWQQQRGSDEAQAQVCITKMKCSLAKIAA